MLCVFRETFLVWLTPPGAADAFRFVGNLFFDLMLNAEDWPTWTESPVQAELRAAAADLRFLQGFLTTIRTQERASELSVEDARLSRLAARQAAEVAGIARRIEEELARWTGEAKGA
ncbi:MAG TPA: hypothetical protein VGG03_13310 [Thermoanaerobaculia bacterium]|jgi:hypothetical protein